MKLTQIVVGPRPARLVAFAAAELARYAGELFGHSPRIVAAPRRGRGRTITLDAAGPPLPERLSDQGYVLRPAKVDTIPVFQAAGRSPVATTWAVYDLVERWGVRYELHGDLFPDRPGPMRLPDGPIVCEPDLRLRAFRTYNDFANNPCRWPAEDYRVLIDQLAKMRMNGLYMVCRPCDPFVDLEFRGARKSLAVTNFGWKLPIRPDHPGHGLFERSGDAARGEFANRDLDGHASYQRAHEAGKKYIRKIFRMAHARGMRCILSFNFTDFDPAIKKRLAECTSPRHKARRGPVFRLKYGVWSEGPDVEVGRCMSVNNPVFFDLMAAAIQAHVDCVPDADVYCPTTTEFGGSAADCDRAWRRLDRKYGLGKIAPLDQLVADARRMAEDDPDRSERELRANVVVLYAMDVLLNEWGFDLSKARKGARIAPGGLGPELHRFLPVVFPNGTDYLAGKMGYMPTHVAKRTDTLRMEDPESIRMWAVTSLEDDNVGLVPQLTGPAVHKIITALRSVKANGFLTRQWQHSNLLPTLHYLSHSGWERGWTPAKAYGHFFADLCGPLATPELLRAFRGIERNTEDLHSSVLCISFPVPGWIVRMWDDWPEKLTPDRLRGVARAYEGSADLLRRAVKFSRPAGKDFVHSLERHVRHAVCYLEALRELCLARHASQAARRARQANDFDACDRAWQSAVGHVDGAASQMRLACETFAEGVRDRCDLGALASLNCYNLDVVDALARITRAKADMFSCREQ